MAHYITSIMRLGWAGLGWMLEIPLGKGASQGIHNGCFRRWLGIELSREEHGISPDSRKCISRGLIHVGIVLHGT